MAESAPFERLLKRDRAITLAGLAVLCAISWLYIVQGAGLGMSASQMTRLALFPHRNPQSMMPGMACAMCLAPSQTWGLSTWVLMIGMWWVMMIAMMTASAAPTIVLYARVHRHAVAQERDQDKLAPTGAFAWGYLLVWLGFSAAATSLHWGLQRAGLVSSMMMESQSRWLSAVILIAAGVYQLSPFKNMCLTHCRMPSEFLARHWRPHTLGAVRLGALHGAYCMGCCWVLMALLFVVGVMNLIWIGVLAIVVLMEKAMPRGLWFGRVAGAALIVWGLATIVV